jgi:hypothetical protein
MKPTTKLYYVLLNTGETTCGYPERYYAEILANAARDNKHVYPVAIIKAMPPKEDSVHEMEQMIREVFADIPGITFSHQ